MLSSFVDSLFKVPYGTPIELPHASMWSKLVKIDFTSSLLMLSIAYPYGHTLKDTLEDTLNGSWLMEHPKGHNPRDTPQGTHSEQHNWETLISRDMLQGTRIKGHDQGTRLKGHNWGTRLRDTPETHPKGHALRINPKRDTSIRTHPGFAAQLKVS